MSSTQQKHPASLCIPRGSAIIPHTCQRLWSHSSWAQFCLWSDSSTSPLHANWHESYLAVLRLNELSWEGAKSSLSLKQTDWTVRFTKITSAKFLFSIYNKVAVNPTEQQINFFKKAYIYKVFTQSLVHKSQPVGHISEVFTVTTVLPQWKVVYAIHLSYSLASQPRNKEKSPFLREYKHSPAKQKDKHSCIFLRD